MEKRYAKIRIRQLLKFKTTATKNLKRLVREASLDELFETTCARKGPLWYWARAERKLVHNLIAFEEC